MQLEYLRQRQLQRVKNKIEEQRNMRLEDKWQRELQVIVVKRLSELFKNVIRPRERPEKRKLTMDENQQTGPSNEIYQSE